MADYHIYLHSEGGAKSSSNQTKPFSQKQTEESGGGFQTTAKTFESASSTAKDGATSVGVAALAKVVPWLAILIAAVNVVDKVLTAGFAHQEEYTGYYKNNVAYNNFKTGIHNIIHPIQYAMSEIHNRKQFDKKNKEIAQQNRLIGSSILKDFNIGV